MEKRDLYELLGRTYAQLSDESDMASYWQEQYEDMSRTVKILLADNDRLKKELKEYEQKHMEGHNSH